MKKSVTVAASVTLYNSLPASLFAIETYRTQVERLYVVDNSDTGDGAVVTHLEKLSNVICLPNKGNLGVAHALNQAAQAATKEGFSHLLTMDDDTYAPSNMVSEMIAFLKNSHNVDKVGIVSALHNDEVIDSDCRTVLTTMTSGNLLNLTIYKDIGPFREEFFIDHVDHEYGLRLSLSGYQIVELLKIRLKHNLGERKMSGLGGFSYISHAPVRGYYIVRNGLVMIGQYSAEFPAFGKHLRNLLMKEVVKAVFFESRKLHRLRLLWRGMVDANAGRLGKLDE